MSFFDPLGQREPERRMPVEETAYYRRVLSTHKNDPGSGVCAVCQVCSCPDWRNAFDRLAEAGELMGG